MIQLTNHLYPLQHVIASFVHSMSVRGELRQSLFWLWELVHTLENIGDGILCIVSLFYAHAPVSLLRYISRKIAEVEATSKLCSRSHLLSDLVTNLRRVPQCTNGYLIHQSLQADTYRPEFIYRNRLGSTNSAACLRGAMDNVRPGDIGFYLARVPPSTASRLLEGDKAILLLWDGRSHPQDGIISAALAARKCHRQPIAGNWRFTTCDKVVTDWLRDLYTVLDDPNISPRKKLGLTRKYSVSSPVADSSSLPSEDVVLNASRHHWLACASDGTAWKRRLQSFNVSVKGNVCSFPDSEAEERFYELYGLEFDEQPADVQARSVLTGVSALPSANARSTS